VTVAVGDLLGERGAAMSEDRRYRYALWRRWGDGGRTVAFIGLNPSTADEVNDDATIRRCIGFARSWGYQGLVMLNLFALVSTDPDRLLTDPDPVGPEADEHLRRYTADAALVVAAWGAFPQARARAPVVVAALGLELRCLGVTKEGAPRHPCRLHSDTQPVHWPLRRCRECGCTDGRACLFVVRGRALRLCDWMDDDLCSACIPDIAPLVGGPRTAHLWRHPEPLEPVPATGRPPGGARRDRDVAPVPTAGNAGGSSDDPHSIGEPNA
jgi:hypothetical protein